MNSYEFGGFVSFTLAIILLFIGKALIGKIEILRRYSIPEPVIGGFLPLNKLFTKTEQLLSLADGY